jgi:hypothetical protein
MTPQSRKRRARRAAIVVMVAGGALAAASPAGAISGNAGDVDASAAQYLAPSENIPLGEETTGQGEPPPQNIPLGEEPGGEAPEQAVLPTESAPSTPVEVREEASLPLTGYAVLAVLLAGVASLLAGLVLRRQSIRRSPS